MTLEQIPATRWIPAIFLALAVFALGLGLNPNPAMAKPVYASIVVDAKTGAVLQATNADKATYPASLTKMMTLYLLFEALDKGKIKLSDKLTFSANAARQPATNLHSDPGDTIRVETAILALVVRSANDASVVIAEKLGGSEAGFAKMMNAKAKALGMTKSVFKNPNGLPNPKQRTTARDMATLGIALMRDFPHYYDYFSRRSFVYQGVTYTGHNRLLNRYPGADGIKTGYIRLSGYNLVTSAEHNDRRLVGVVLGGKSSASRDQQMIALLDQGFKTKKGNGQVLTAKLGKQPSPSKKPAAEPVEVAAAETPEAAPEENDQNPQLVLASADAASLPETETDIDEAPLDAALASMSDTGAPSATQEIPAIAAPAPETLADAEIPAAPAEAEAPAAATIAALPLPAPKPQPAATAKPAPAPETVAAAPAEAPVWRDKGNYGIQVGAYAQYKPALKAANKAAGNVPKILADARIAIEQAEKNGGTIYRARLLGLSKKDAETACRKLAAKSTDCMVFKADSSVAMTSN